MESDAQKAPISQAAAEQSEKSSVVFIVDDSITMRAMLHRVLSQMSFTVHEANSGEAVLELLKTTTPDAILLDVEMEGIGGFVACEQIRLTPNGKHIPIMMVTSLEDLESINRAYKAGATDFTTKPINWDIIGHRVRYMIRTSRDFLELQKTRFELDQLNLDLEERVIHRTQQLKAANFDLKKMLDQLQTTQNQLVEAEKLASLGSLVAGIAHEVNTPIGITITAISMLDDNLNKMYELYSNNQLRRSDFTQVMTLIREAIQLATKNLQRSVELIKSFKQVSADQISENRREINLKSYLEEILISLKPSLHQTKLTTQINCPTDLVVDTYPGAIFQIITIFVMNSITHAYDPGEPGTLTIEAKLSDQTVELCYSDTGKGIAPDIINKIFEPFFTTKRNTGSTGLGLNIAYNTVTQLLGGTLKCTSNLGQGAFFIVHFPKGNAAKNI